ncbi:hypothetical protein I4U23_011457 [Adineta vaga]|nr:hypothetical protein I4U23_011457 [Adineta vaga]
MRFLRFLLFALISFHSNIHGKKTYSIRNANVKIIPNSFYQPGYYKHFLGSLFNIQSLSDCIYQCHENEYCRTAIYSFQSFICLLYEEFSFLGQILPSTDQSLISFSYCPDQSINELTHVCYGSQLLSSVAIGDLFDQIFVQTPIATFPAYARSSTWSTTMVIFAPMWGVDVYSAHDINNDYVRMKRQAIVPNITILSIDSDDLDYFAIVESSPGRLYLRSNSMNQTIYPTKIRGTCMSDQYVVVIPYFSTNQTLYVYHKFNRSQAFLLPSPANGVVTCLILNQRLYIVGYPPDPPIQSILLDPNRTINNYSIVLKTNQCLQALYPLNVDSSGRLYSVCLNNTATHMMIFTIDGTILSRIYHSFFNYTQLGIKLTKYRIQYAGSNATSTNIYEF